MLYTDVCLDEHTSLHSVELCLFSQRALFLAQSLITWKSTRVFTDILPQSRHCCSCLWPHRSLTPTQCHCRGAPRNGDAPLGTRVRRCDLTVPAEVCGGPGAAGQPKYTYLCKPRLRVRPGCLQQFMSPLLIFIPMGGRFFGNMILNG